MLNTTSLDNAPFSQQPSQVIAQACTIATFKRPKQENHEFAIQDELHNWIDPACGVWRWEWWWRKTHTRTHTCFYYISEVFVVEIAKWHHTTAVWAPEVALQQTVIGTTVLEINRKQKTLRKRNGSSNQSRSQGCRVTKYDIFHSQICYIKANQRGADGTCHGLRAACCHLSR